MHEVGTVVFTVSAQLGVPVMYIWPLRAVMADPFVPKLKKSFGTFLTIRKGVLLRVKGQRAMLATRRWFVVRLEGW